MCRLSHLRNQRHQRETQPFAQTRIYGRARLFHLRHQRETDISCTLPIQRSLRIKRFEPPSSTPLAHNILAQHVSLLAPLFIKCNQPMPVGKRLVMSFDSHAAKVMHVDAQRQLDGFEVALLQAA